MKQRLCTLILFAFYSIPLFASLSEKRKFQLDSITSTIDKVTSKNIVLTHEILHNYGQNDEERIWLFYGYIATYFRYDDQRKAEFSKDNEYSPEYTAQKSSGVCRDFSKVFLYLCQKSKIPCFNVVGKSKESFFVKIPMAIKRFIHRVSNKANHAWNVVRVNHEWQLMDPTWTSIKRKEKFKVYNAKTKSYFFVTVKIPDRTYFNPDPYFMMKSHAPAHPAFLLCGTVPTYKTVLKKDKRKKVKFENYHFQQKLDSMFLEKYPDYCRIYTKESYDYSKVPLVHYQYYLLTNSLKDKRSRYNPITVQQCDSLLSYISSITKYIKEQNGIDFSSKYKAFEVEVEQKKSKLIKQEANKKKK